MVVLSLGTIADVSKSIEYYGLDGFILHFIKNVRNRK